MSKTVVGLFKSTSEAQGVKHDLVRQGYSASDISVVANEEKSSVAATNPTNAEGGLGAAISNFFRSLTSGDEEAQHYYAEGVNRGGAVLSVRVPDGKEDEVAECLERSGAQDVNDHPATSVTAHSSPRTGTEGASIPVVEETLQVGKRQVQRGGVRIYSHLVEQPVEATVQLREEHVRVGRQKVDRPATEGDFAAFQEGTIELTETAEEAVVSKQARVVEEVVVGKDDSERTQTIRDTVRHTEVELEQLGAGNTPRLAGFADYDSAFRHHFETTYGAGGRSFDAYSPAYKYGYTLANDPQNLSSPWSDVEVTAERDWTAKGSGKWEDVKGAVQEGWNKVRSGASSQTNY